jgi:hypothetical protein
MKNRSDWDWLVGPEDYHFSFPEILMLALFLTLIGTTIP